MKGRIGFVLSWIFGVIFLLSGLGAFSSGEFLPGIIMFILAAIFLPPVSSFVEKKSKLQLKPGIKAIILIVGLVIFGTTISTEKNAEKPDHKAETVRVEQSPKLGLSRSQVADKMREVETKLENPPLPEGKEYSLSDGTKKYTIVYPDDLTILELVGNPDNIERVSFSAGIPADNPMQAVTQVGRTIVLLQLITPSLGKSAKWLQSRLDELNKGKKEIEEIHDNVNVRISDHRTTIGASLKTPV